MKLLVEAPVRPSKFTELGHKLVTQLIGRQDELHNMTRAKVRLIYIETQKHRFDMESDSQRVLWFKLLRGTKTDMVKTILEAEFR